MEGTNVDIEGKQQALLAWLNTFSSQIEALKTNNLTHLSNGVAIYHLLNYLIPRHFNHLSDINNDSNDAFSSMNNLKKVIEAICTFLSDFNSWNEDCTYLKLPAIVSKDITEIISLLELVIFCAIKSPKKGEVIHKIENLDHDTMACLASIIQKMTSIFDKEPSERGPEWSSSAKHHHFESFKSKAREDIIQFKRNNERLTNDLLQSNTQITYLNKVIKTLRIQVTNLIEEKEKIKEERDMSIKEAVDAAVADVREKGRANTQLAEQKAKESIKDLADNHLRKLEDELKLEKKRFEDLSKEHNKEIEFRDKKLRRHKEQLELLEVKLMKFDQLEKSVGQYKKKIEDTKMLGNKLQEMREKYDSNFNEMIIIKNKLKDIPILKQRISKYKHRIMNMETKIIDIKAESDKKENMLRIVSEEKNQYTCEQERTVEELRDELRAKEIELRNQPIRKDNAQETSLSTQVLNSKIHELEEKLKSCHCQESSSTIEELKHELEIAQSTVQASKQKFVTLTKRNENIFQINIDLKKEIKKIKMENISLMKKLEKQTGELKDIAKEILKKKNKKADKLRDENEKLNYDIQQLKVEKLMEKHDMEQQLKTAQANNKELMASSIRERKIMTRAWYKLALELRTTKLLSTKPGKPKRNSWLTRQREYTGLTPTTVDPIHK